MTYVNYLQSCIQSSENWGWNFGEAATTWEMCLRGKYFNILLTFSMIHCKSSFNYGFMCMHEEFNDCELNFSCDILRFMREKWNLDFTGFLDCRIFNTFIQFCALDFTDKFEKRKQRSCLECEVQTTWDSSQKAIR